MGHVLLAGPRIENFALADATVRLLQRRGTRVSVLATDPITARFLFEHGVAHRLLAPTRVRPRLSGELDDFAQREVRFRGQPGSSAEVDRARRFLARRLSPLLRAFESDLPDLLLTIDARGGLDRLIHATARSFGCATAHLGRGLVPGTLQHDAEGIDGDRAPYADDRALEADRALVDSAIAVALAGGAPQVGALPRVVFRPRLLDRLRARFTSEDRPAARARMQAWLDAADAPLLTVEASVRDLPAAPFVAVLLQAPDDPRIRLDVDGPSPDPRELVAEVRRITSDLGLGDTVVAVLDPAQSHRAALAAMNKVHVAPHHSAATVAALASVVITVNHPQAAIGALAGTPTFCLGRAMYAREGLAWSALLPGLGRVVESKGRERRTAAAHRAATVLLRDEHLWCDPERPDSNGLAGLARFVEGLLAKASPPPPPVHYEPGPIWPGERRDVEG